MSSETRATSPREPSLYWDWNATTPPHADVLAAMQQAYELGWANASSQHQRGRAARAIVEEVREQLAALADVHPRDVVFTSCGTEANNLALRGARALVVSRLDHPSVVRCAENLEASGVPVVWARVPEHGRLEPADVLDALRALPGGPTGATVVLTAANHETGVVQDVPSMVERVRAEGARVHVDAAQALGKLHPEAFLGADSFTFVAHKIRGPQGIAALAWRGPAPHPVLAGGGQERGLRPGTLSAPLVAGFGAALRRLDPARYAPLAGRRDALERALADFAVINGGSVPRLPHVSNLSCEGWSGERLVAALDVRGLCISTGSACRVGTAEPSVPVGAMLGPERAKSAVRISFGETTDDAELARGIDILRDTLRGRRRAASSDT